MLQIQKSIQKSIINKLMERNLYKTQIRVRLQVIRFEPKIRYQVYTKLKIRGLNLISPYQTKRETKCMVSFFFFVVHRMGNKTYPKSDALSTVRFQFKTCCSKELSYNIKNVCMMRILRYKGMSLKLYDK